MNKYLEKIAAKLIPMGKDVARSAIKNVVEASKGMPHNFLQIGGKALERDARGLLGHKYGRTYAKPNKFEIASHKASKSGTLEASAKAFPPGYRKTYYRAMAVAGRVVKNKKPE